MVPDFAINSSHQDTYNETGQIMSMTSVVSCHNEDNHTKNKIITVTRKIDVHRPSKPKPLEIEEPATVEEQLKMSFHRCVRYLREQIISKTLSA